MSKKHKNQKATSAGEQQSAEEAQAGQDRAEAVQHEQETVEKEVLQAEPAVMPEPKDEALEMRLLRLQADFDNYKKRTLREKAEWSERANEDILKELLPVLDHFELGLKTAEQHKTDPSVLTGFTMVYDQFVQTLKKFKLEPIEAEGTTFDPHLHEAITHMPSESHAPDEVMAMTRRGYKLGDKLLRAAQVVVSSGSAENIEEKPGHPDEEGAA